MGRCQIDQNSNHIATSNDLARSTVILCPSAVNKANQQWNMGKAKVQAARQKRNIYGISSDEVEDFGANCSEHQVQYKLEIPVERTPPCVTQVRIPDLQGTDAENCSVKRRREKTPSSERRATSSDNKRKAKRSVRITKAFSSPRTRSFARGSRCISRIFHSWHRYHLVHARAEWQNQQFQQQKLQWAKMGRNCEPTSVEYVKSNK